MQLIIALCLGCLALGFGSGFYTHYKFSEADKVTDLQETIGTLHEITDIGNSISTDVEATKSDIQVRYITRYKKVIEYVPASNKSPDCNLNDDTVRLLNEAATGTANTSSQSGGNP